MLVYCRIRMAWYYHFKGKGFLYIRERVLYGVHVCVCGACVYVLYIAKILQRIMRGVVAGNNCIERDEWDGRIHKVRKAKLPHN